MTKVNVMEDHLLEVTDPYIDWKGRLCVTVMLPQCETEVYEIVGMFDEMTYQLKQLR